MGQICHNAMIVTGTVDIPDRFANAYKKAMELFGPLVSPIIQSNVEGYLTFFVAPDGSKEGWENSDEGDKKRKALCDFIDTLVYEDGSNAVRYIDVVYGETRDGAPYIERASYCAGWGDHSSIPEG